jgi:CO dehydrogenase maturation factor
MGELPDHDSGEITVLDMEASIEHLTRGTVRNVDALLVITEPYYRSLETTGRVVPLALQLGLKRVWVVANKVRSEREAAAVREYCARREFEIIGVVPFDESVTEADHQGRALIDYAPESPAVVAVEALADVVLHRTGTPPTARVTGGN